MIIVKKEESDLVVKLEFDEWYGKKELVGFFGGLIVFVKIEQEDDVVFFIFQVFVKVEDDCKLDFSVEELINGVFLFKFYMVFNNLLLFFKNIVDVDIFDFRVCKIVVIFKFQFKISNYVIVVFCEFMGIIVEQCVYFLILILQVVLFD